MLRKMLFLLPLCLPMAAGAQTSDQALTETLEKNIRMVRHLALNPLLVDAVQRQNDQALDMQIIRQRDRDWSNTGQFTQLKTGMQEGYHSLMMQNFIDRHETFSEAVLTDNRGANVAAYPLTGDYWQGDESGWQQSFNQGDGQVYISPLKQDPSTGVISTYIAAPVLNRTRAVGVLLVAVELNNAR